MTDGSPGAAQVPPADSELRFRKYGLALAYVSLPLGSFSEEADLIRATATGSSLGLRPRISYVCGQSDLAVRINLTNIEDVLRFEYPRASSQALGVNWIFALPYQHLTARDDDARRAPSKNSAWLEFTLHLRFRRSVTAYPGAEHAVVKRLEEFLRERSIDFRILIGLGWSDLIVDARIPAAQFEAFTQFLLRAHELQLEMPTGRNPVFQRTLTIFGYPWSQTPPRDNAAGHISFARARPGHYQSVADSIAKAFPPDQFSIYLIDGKTDLLIVDAHNKRNDAEPPFLQRVQDLAEFRNGENAVQKVESHFIFENARTLNRVDPDEVTIRLQSDVRHRECRCAEAARQRESLLKPYVDRLIPSRAHALRNLLFQFTTAMRDPTICCDLASAVQASEITLVPILAQLARVETRPPAGPARAAHPATHPTQTSNAADEQTIDPTRRENDIDGQLDSVEADVASLERRYHAIVRLSARRERLYELLDDWQLHTERAMSQRTVGSFEELLAHSDRVTTYRGGVQKLLYLADGLINDFAHMIDLAPSRLAFVTFYDSVETIETISDANLVRIPVRNLFRLPYVMVDLWHEVGATLYRIWYPRSRMPRDPSIQDRVGLYSDLADAYGDLIVFWYGFRGRLKPFCDSFLRGWIETYGERSAVAPILGALTRIYSVAELYFASQFKEHGSRFPIGSRPATSFTVAALQTILGSRYPREDRRHALVDPASRAWPELLRNSRSRFYATYLRPLVREFVERHRRVAPVPAPPIFDDGVVRNLENVTDLNGVYAAFLERIDNPTTTLKEAFRPMAALGKSVVQEYYRRQMT